MSELQAQHLHKKFRGRSVLNDVSLNVQGGEIVGLLGPNGAGKTTCFHIMVGLLKPDHGIIRMNSEDISQKPVHQRGQLGLAYLPQEKSIFTDLTTVENVQAILELQTPKQKTRNAALALLHEMGIEHLAEESASTLSGGERRRVEIARLLAVQPKFILMDEPFAAIAPIAVKDFQKIISSLSKRGIGILITDHNVRETLTICDRSYILDNGKVLTEGDVNTIIHNQTVRDAYLGEDFGM